MISHAVGFPVTEAIAAQARHRTDGFPRYMQTVAAHLLRTPLGRRGIDAACDHALAGDELQAFRQEIAESVEAEGSTRELLQLLAVAARPLTRHMLEEFVGGPVDVADLMATKVVSWDETSFGYTIEYCAVARALLGELTPEEVAEIHQRLVPLSDRFAAFRHRAPAVRLAGDDAHRSLHQELMSSAAELWGSGDLDETLEQISLAAQVMPTEETLAKLALAAVPTGQLRRVVSFEPAIRALPLGQARAALLAFIALERNDPHQALVELEAQKDLDPYADTFPTYAQAVCDTGGHLAMRSTVVGADALHDRTLAALQSFEDRLRNEHTKQLSENPARKPPAWELGYAAALRGLVELWHVLNTEGAGEAQTIITEITILIERLARYPGT
ncbi:hypothetical protein [Nesterenkonia flava]|uniref:Uncharacterized protein n=1 Tax=Nesterenkonia flava TaxID=469799 RepID=A0ABU1FV78_9MICC|nr:hypothetical protein [Nesterenkonia flava]MDR5712581.1 hypothetical protein [Nesterenkonia flava]